MKIEQGDVAVVTGAASGIGFALAEHFAKAGCSVVAADVDQRALDEATTSLGHHGTDVIGVRTDVSKEGEVKHLAQETLDRFGAVHIVCNNAGVVARSDPWMGPIAGWEWVFGVNLWGVVHGVRAFLPHLVLGGRGHIVNTASMAGLMPGLDPIYDATKHAVVALTEDLYLNLQAAGFPVGVSVLCPGWVRTNIMDADRNWPEELGTLPEPRVGSEVALGYVGRAIAEGMTPAAVADLVATCVEEERFWVLPHADWMGMASARWDRVAEGVNPSPAGEIPGLPPMEQVVAEMAALAERDEA
jgi:NAD(P)-dependent dehydrogenase (short-subunit alcohol dehydrogenase family)